MTRILAELLEAKQPAFRQGLQQLEQASGGAAEDIRLTAEITHATHDRLRQLSLDPLDTTGRELYAALMQRVRHDSEAFNNLLGSASLTPSALVAAVAKFVISAGMPVQAFALRPVSAKKLLRQHPPKRAMKRLGYRSLESMLKHEPCSLIFAATHLAEAASWHKSMAASYRKLAPSDFECRDIQILAPANPRWESLAKEYVVQSRQNIVGLRELGSIVLLPMPAIRLDAAPLAMTMLTLQAVNDIAAASTYLKMHQVQPDFGGIVAAIARSEPQTKAELAGANLPWNLVHRYFAKHPEAYNPHLFEPHVQQEDLRWHNAEDVLAKLHPRFEFWQGSGHLGLLAKGSAVSLNLMDSVLSFCNRLPYEQRFSRYVRDRIWHELLLRYMRQGNIEQKVHRQLGGLDAETAGLS